MKRTVLCFALIAVFASVPVSASTFVAMSDLELVSGSEAIVLGQVDQVHSFWNEDGTAVLTEAVIHVEKVVAGAAPATVTVRTFGGTVGDYHLVAHGFPTFEEGQRTFLYLERGTQNAYKVTGYQLGLYRVRPGADGTAMAMPSLEEGIRLVRADGTPAPAPRAVQLDELVQRVQKLAVSQTPTPTLK